MKRAKSTPKAKSALNFSRADVEHAAPFWTERVKTVLDGTNSAHLISELATLKATLALPLNLALPIAKLKFRFGPNKVYSERPPFAVKRGARRPWCSGWSNHTSDTIQSTTVGDCKVNHGFDRTFASSEGANESETKLHLHVISISITLHDASRKLNAGRALQYNIPRYW